jgi:hypothetical protein
MTGRSSKATLHVGAGIEGHEPGGFGMGLPVARVGAPLTVGALVVCVDQGSARVRSVAFRDNDGVSVRGFSVRTVDTRSGAVMAAPKSTSLAETEFPAEPAAVHARCGQEAILSELAVEFALASGNRGHAENLVVTYYSDGATDEVVIPFELVLCASPGVACL